MHSEDSAQQARAQGANSPLVAAQADKKSIGMATFIAAPGHPAQPAVLILAAMAGVPITVNPPDADVQEPVLTLANGTKIVGSGAIVRHIARWHGSGKLLPAAPVAAANADAWLDLAKQIEAAAFAWVQPFASEPARNTEYQRDVARTFIERSLGALQTHLQTAAGGRLAGGATSAADVVMACTLLPLYESVLGAKVRAAYPAVEKYLASLAAEPALAKVLGKPAFCSEADGWHCGAAASSSGAGKKDKKAKKGGDGAAADPAPAAPAGGKEGEEVDPEKAAKKVRLPCRATCYIRENLHCVSIRYNHAADISTPPFEHDCVHGMVQGNFASLFRACRGPADYQPPYGIACTVGIFTLPVPRGLHHVFKLQNQLHTVCRPPN